MSKEDTLNKLIKLLAHAISHKIGSIVNKDNYYAEKYAKEAINFFNLAKKASLEANWNREDLATIERSLRKKIISELESKDFLDNSKFDFVNVEIKKTMVELMC